MRAHFVGAPPTRLPVIMTSIDEALAQTTRVPEQTLRDFAVAAFSTLGVPDEDAENAANTLVEADLRGIGSHGMARLDRFYITPLEAGLVTAAPEWIITAESQSTATIDADGGLGLSVGVRAMNLAIEKAQAVGSGWVTVANSRHFGAAGVYATQALEHDMIGIAMTNTGPIVLPAGGTQPRLGSNPIAMAAPSADGDAPFIFDAATSVVSAGKFDSYHRAGKLAPEGWALTDDLQPVRNPERGPGGRRILPLGSDLEHSSYKGYGLAMIVDILSGVLSGMGPGLAIAGSGVAGGYQSAHFFGALRIDAFTEPLAFKQSMSDYLAALRETPPMPDVDSVRVPGDIEAETIADRTKNGIPLYADSIESLQNVAQRLGLRLSLDSE